MEENFDRLTVALRQIAHEDAAAAPAQFDARIRAELRLRRRTAPTAGRLFGFGIAAALAAAIGGALWLATRLPRLSGGPPALTRNDASYGAPGPPALTNGEIRTSFMPLMYSAIPYTDAEIVRLEVPRRVLVSFGLAAADLSAEAAAAGAQTTVLADVLVGEDGLARAVRFVRPERAP